MRAQNASTRCELREKRAGLAESSSCERISGSEEHNNKNNNKLNESQEGAGVETSNLAANFKYKDGRIHRKL